MQNYSNVAVSTTLAAAITAGATSILVGATTGFPSVDFTLVIDPGTASEELVLVTNVAGTTLTVTRGYDGTSASSHSVGAVVQHVHSAKDFADARAHEAATAAHGATGAVVGTTNTQTLTNKSISVDSNTVGGVAASSFVLSDASGNIDGAAAQKVVPAGAVVGTTDAQTLSNKTLTNPTINHTSGWTSYTPTSSTITLGNGALSGRYRKIGRTVHFAISFVWGSTTTIGSSDLRFSLPSSYDSFYPNVFPIGTAYLLDSSAGSGSRTIAAAATINSTEVMFVSAKDTGGNVNTTTPWTWATGDQVYASGTYEEA